MAVGGIVAGVSGVLELIKLARELYPEAKALYDTIFKAVSEGRDVTRAELDALAAESDQEFDLTQAYLALKAKET